MIDLDRPTTRELPLDPARAALLFIDVQNYCARPDGGEFETLGDDERRAKLGYLFERLETSVLPNMRRLQRACRAAKIEVLYTVIESLTQDGRDRGLDYKITGFNVPKGSWDAKVLDAIEPLDDEIVIPKTSSDVFASTNIDYVLRNLNVRQLVVSGLVTDQCVSSAVRHACDLGYLVTVVTDACATYTATRHESALREIGGYCRQITTDALVRELEERNG